MWPGPATEPVTLLAADSGLPLVPNRRCWGNEASLRSIPGCRSWRSEWRNSLGRWRSLGRNASSRGCDRGHLQADSHQAQHDSATDESEGVAVGPPGVQVVTRRGVSNRGRRDHGAQTCSKPLTGRDSYST